MSNATRQRRDLTTFCRLDELGLEATGQCLYPDLQREESGACSQLGDDVLFSLESEEQKQVRRQIAGKAPIDPDHLGVTRAAAVQLRKGLATQLLPQPLMPCVFAVQALNFALGGDNLVAALMATAVAGTVIADGFLIRDFPRTGRFLTRTAEQDASKP